MKKVLFALVFFCGCATSPINDDVVIKSFNNRISDLEEKMLQLVNTTTPTVKNLPINNRGLTESQKDFIRVIMDYLGR